MEPEATIETIAHDIFMLGLGAAAIFIKNPATQGRANNIAQLLAEVFPFLAQGAVPPTPVTPKG